MNYHMGADIPGAELSPSTTPKGFDYSFEQFEKDMENMQPRFFDKYILPGFLLWFAYSSKKDMGRWPRRILFTSGIYMFYRNYKYLKEGSAKIVAKVNEMKTSLPSGVV